MPERNIPPQNPVPPAPPEQANAEEDRKYKEQKHGVEKDIGSELDALKTSAGKVSIEEAVEQIGITDLKHGNIAPIGQQKKSYKSSLKQVRTYQGDIAKIQGTEGIPPQEGDPAPAIDQQPVPIAPSKKAPPIITPQAPAKQKKSSYRPYTTTLGKDDGKALAHHPSENSPGNIPAQSPNADPNKKQQVQPMHATAIQSVLTDFLTTTPKPPTTAPGQPAKQLRTYDDDLAHSIRTGNKSIISVAIDSQKNPTKAALANRELTPKKPINWKMLSISAALILVGITTVYFGFTLSNKSPTPAAILTTGAIINPDRNKEVLARAVTRKDFTNLVLQTKVPNGSILHFYITEQDSASANLSRDLVTSSEFLSFFDTQIDDAFLRALNPNFMFGVHRLKKNEPFLILKTKSYDHAFAGMLSWEQNLRDDLTPLFGSVSDTFIEKTEEIVDANGATTTSVYIDTVKPDVRQYEDVVIRNRDTRVIRDQNGEIVFLYSFPNKETLIITTNNATFVEILARMSSSK
ncbi:hypothetical protein COB55_04990 [Candidatus Wolfebacteria bacterium]|nr:MAG: hypothetical protein COB55_04990 [Candidatus Wolfebacteria bacterium]